MRNQMSNLNPTEIPGYAKKGGAVVNVDNAALESYKRKKMVNRRIAVLEEEVAQLKEAVAQLLARDNTNG